LYYFNLPNFNIVGSSPEILVRLRKNKITIRPIAGTRPRGKNKSLDKNYEKDLLSDKKEVSEHLMLLDLGRNDVGKVSKSGTVKVTSSFYIEKYSHVMHIVSNVQGTIKKNKTPIDALMAGFPAGTVTGAPKIRAMEIIDELEDTKRGIYAGGIGYISSNGEMDTCIALRTGIIHKKKLYVQAGGGIVYDSNPEMEYLKLSIKQKHCLMLRK
jgi:anthranilate synthase component 1